MESSCCDGSRRNVDSGSGAVRLNLEPGFKVRRRAIRIWTLELSLGAVRCEFGF